MTPNDHHSFDNVAEPTAQTMTYGGGIGAVSAWALSWGDVAAIVGVITALVGLGFQVYFGIRRERRQRELHRLQIEKLKEKDDGS